MCGLLDRFKKKQVRKETRDRQIPVTEIDEEAAMDSLKNEIGYEGKLSYESGKGLIAHVRITNNTDTPWGNLKLGIAFSSKGLFIPSEEILRCEMLDPGRTEVFKFYLDPSLREGMVDISLNFTYFDFNRKENIEIAFPGIKAKMKMPRITKERFKMDEIFDTDWRVIVSQMEKYEVESDVIEKKSSTVFLDLREAIASMGLHSFKPEVNPNIYRALNRFWAKDKAENKYGVHLEVIGKDDKTKALIIFYASDHMKLLPLASGIVNSIRGMAEYKRSF